MRLTKAELASIEARMKELPDPDLDDPDNPEWTAEDFARARPASELPPEILALFPNTRRGRPRKPEGERKKPVKLNLDPDVIAAFKADGPGWQSRMNQALRAAKGL